MKFRFGTVIPKYLNVAVFFKVSLAIILCFCLIFLVFSVLPQDQFSYYVGFPLWYVSFTQ